MFAVGFYLFGMLAPVVALVFAVGVAVLFPVGSLVVGDLLTVAFAVLAEVFAACFGVRPVCLGVHG